MLKPLRSLSIAALVVALLTGCAHYPNISQSRSPCQMAPGGWCDFIAEAAVEAWPYAIASTNAYVGDSDLYQDISPVLEVVPVDPLDDKDDGKGFGYQVFKRIPDTSRTADKSPATGPSGGPEYIIAFRGTDFDLGAIADVYYGSLKSSHIKLALKYFEREKARAPANARWVATGHSLGGALATEVSITHGDVKAYMFNTSPFYKSDATTNAMQRMVFNERGEVLRGFRKYKPYPASEVFTLNCSPQKGSFTKHKIRRIGDCLIWIAAYRSQQAEAMVKAEPNAIVKPLVECGPPDKQHPGQIAGEMQPCLHIARPEAGKPNPAQNRPLRSLRRH